VICGLQGEVAKGELGAAAEGRAEGEDRRLGAEQRLQPRTALVQVRDVDVVASAEVFEHPQADGIKTVHPGHNLELVDQAAQARGGDVEPAALQRVLLQPEPTHFVEARVDHRNSGGVNLDAGAGIFSAGGCNEGRQQPLLVFDGSRHVNELRVEGGDGGGGGAVANGGRGTGFAGVGVYQSAEKLAHAKAAATRRYLLKRRAWL
jgi:hypothetical protein